MNPLKGINKLMIIGKKNSPQIMVGAGVVGMVGTVVLASKATLKVEDIVDESKRKLDMIKQVTENPEDYGEYHVEDEKRDKAVIYTQTVLSLAKVYAPAIVLGTISVAAILGGHRILHRRNVALGAAYKVVDKSFRKYRNNVIDELGKEKDEWFQHGIKAEKVNITETDENGKAKVVKKEKKVVNSNDVSMYARFFDEGNPNWRKTPEYNLVFLKSQQSYANDLLLSRGHLFLNEVYDMLGMDRTQAGQVVGWVVGEGDDAGDNYVDFGIYDNLAGNGSDFVNGWEPTTLLDFNVDGVVYDLI